LGVECAVRKSIIEIFHTLRAVSKLSTDATVGDLRLLKLARINGSGDIIYTKATRCIPPLVSAIKTSETEVHFSSSPFPNLPGYYNYQYYHRHHYLHHHSTRNTTYQVLLHKESQLCTQSHSHNFADPRLLTSIYTFIRLVYR
jgi:hypothetical protein